MRIYFMVFLFSLVMMAQAQSGLEVANKMIARVHSLKSLQCTFESQERVNGKMYTEKTNFKIQITPFKVYFKQDVPVKGLEGLYITGENSGNTRVNPNAFPWVTLDLNPEGDLMMKNHHHPVFHAGYGYVADVLDLLIQKYQSKTGNLITNKGVITYQGQEVIVLDCTNPFYAIKNYTLTKAETPFDMGKRLNINYMSILEENPGLKAYSAIDAGKTIKLPTDYASKMVVYVHKTLMIPLYIKVSDPKGVFEEYKFSNVVVNATFKPEDFKADNPKYNF